MLKMKISDIFFLLICYCFVLVYSELDTLSLDKEPSCESEEAGSLDLSSSGLTRIKASFAKSHAIKYLNLKNNTINEIDRRAFNDLPELECLNLAENNINFHEFYFLYSQTIQTLILNNAFVNNDYYEHISVVSFIRTGLSTLPNLKKLYLGRNNMVSVNTNWNLIKSTSDLTHLYLNENKITSTDFLQLLPSTLSHLYLNRNEISHLSCESLTNLHVLVMDYNQIHSLCGQDYNCNGMALKGAVNLRNISITHVGLQEIESDAFEDQINLQSLDMSYNMIYKFVRHTFDNLTNLKTFRLDGNQLNTIPIICQLKKLEFFSLANNDIEQIDEQTFCELPKLKKLILKNNRLNNIAPGIFNNLKSLEELDLSSNSLISLPQNWITSTSIRRLDLASNLFADLADISLENIKTLEYLDIGNNSLRQITVKDVLFLPKNTTIRLDYCKKIPLGYY